MAPRAKQEEFMIINRRTGKALQSTGLDNGQVVEQASPNGSDAQLWAPVKQGRNMKLLNKASGKVLDVVDGGTEAGAWVHTWEDMNVDSQVWKWVKVTATYRKLMNVQSGKVLDIVDMSEDDGAPAQIWDDVEGEGQQWKIVEPTIEKVAVRKGYSKKGKAPEKVEEKAAETVKAEKPAKAPRKKPGPKPKAKPAPVKEEAKEAAPVVVEVPAEAAPAPVEKAPRKKPGPKAARKPRAAKKK